MPQPQNLSRAEMERIIREGGSVLLPGGRLISAIDGLPPDDQLAREGLADPRSALADLERQQADLDRRMADLRRSLPQPPAESVTTPAEAPPEEAPAESVTTPAEDAPLDAPPEGEAEDRPSARRRKGW